MLKLYKKIVEWEFWPFWFFYIPIYFYWFYLGIRARSLMFFSAANPLMEMGGLANYSKYNVIKQFDAKYLPPTVFLGTEADKGKALSMLQEAGLDFPLVAKPDLGERGKGVVKVNNASELELYLKDSPAPIILQGFLTEPLEFGVMYYRLPNEARGSISSVVQKGFLGVVGNGQSSVGQLLAAEQRGKLYVESIEKRYPELIGYVPKLQEYVVVEPIGNHCRGTTFLNANHLINAKLIDTFDDISKNIKGYYFGRYDLKTESLEALYEGKIKILELNGANSEPAHIYDPSMKLLSAYRHLFGHWKRLYRISVQNHKKGVPYMGLLDGIRLMLKK
ncbi:MAG: D-alanine--D-alanine ligase [Cytophagales bacterium]|nr:MAG: D-alanine--D-alanine ligase [Cytophagales bacterium]TAF59402.1 MAG: D-alanine--D-alanine ligase [Cytophagales bacterium]